MLQGVWHLYNSNSSLADNWKYMMVPFSKKNLLNLESDKNSLDKAHILVRYRAQKHVFPLILSVLKGQQEGTIYTDGQHANYFVIHKFGFADLIETEPNPAFDHLLYDFFIEKKFLTEKIRWYNAPQKWTNKFKTNNATNIQLAERVQWVHETAGVVSEHSHHASFCVMDVSTSNFDEIEAHFNLSLGNRFWSSKQQFLEHSLAVVVYKDNVPAALCYACALVDDVAEIDVFTKEAFRGQGLGKIAVAKFIDKCRAKKVKPHWDCYTNNKSSCSLANYFSFNPYHVYSFAIITK